MLDFDKEIERAVSLVSDKMEVPPEKIYSKDRHQVVAIPRHIIATIVYNKYKSLGLTLEQVGRKLGGRDHTTMINSRVAVENLIYTDPNFKRIFKQISEEFNNVERLSN